MREGLEAILTERGQAMADVPGGSSGLYAKDYRGKDVDTPVYKVDGGIISLLAELRNHEKQAAEELGQWGEKQPLTSEGVEPLTSITVTFVDAKDGRPVNPAV
jgi:hypothetical protein